MKDTAFNQLMELAALAEGPIGTVVKEWSAEDHEHARFGAGLHETLDRAGYVIEPRLGKHGHFVDVTKDGGTVAHGYAQDQTDALLYAMLGAVREEHEAALASVG